MTGFTNEKLEEMSRTHQIYDMRNFAAELLAARKVIEKLPETMDGAVVTAGREVFVITDDGSVVADRAVMCLSDYDEYTPSDAYSTRAAAEAALEAKRKAEVKA